MNIEIDLDEIKKEVKQNKIKFDKAIKELLRGM